MILRKHAEQAGQANRERYKIGPRKDRRSTIGQVRRSEIQASRAAHPRHVILTSTGPREWQRGPRTADLPPLHRGPGNYDLTSNLRCTGEVVWVCVRLACRRT